jgi:hypothetical protein
LISSAACSRCSSMSGCRRRQRSAPGSPFANFVEGLLQERADMTCFTEQKAGKQNRERFLHVVSSRMELPTCVERFSSEVSRPAQMHLVADNHAIETPLLQAGVHSTALGDGGDVPVMQHIDENPGSASTRRLRSASTSILMILQLDTMRCSIR